MVTADMEGEEEEEEEDAVGDHADMHPTRRHLPVTGHHLVPTMTTPMAHHQHHQGILIAILMHEETPTTQLAIHMHVTRTHHPIAHMTRTILTGHRHHRRHHHVLRVTMIAAMT